MQKITEYLTGFAKAFAALVTVIVLLASVVILFGQLSDDAYLVEPIQVPPSLVDNGYTPEVTARWVVDRMLEIKQEAETQKVDEQPIAPDAEKFDMEVPGSGMTLNTIAQALRESLGLRKNAISGEIVAVTSGYQLRLRRSGAPHYRQRLVTDTDVDALINAAAESAVQLTAPFSYAAYLYGKGRSVELGEAIDYCLQYCRDDDRAWAFNLQGIMHDESGNWSLAERSYANALDEDPYFAIAYHNWANTLFKQRQYEEALAKFEYAVKLDPGLHDMSKVARFLLEWGRQLMRESGRDVDAAVEKFVLVERILLSEDGKEMSGDLPALYATWGTALEKMGDKSAAVAKYRQALNGNPDDYAFLQEKIDGLVARDAR